MGAGAVHLTEHFIGNRTEIVIKHYVLFRQHREAPKWLFLS